jgi:uncharacterized membrane protein YfcA
MILIPVLLIFGALSWYICTLAAGGGAMLMIPLVGLLIGPHLVAPTITIGSVIAAPSRVLLFWPYINWSVIRWMLPGSILGAMVGAYIYSQMHPIWLQLLVGIFLMSTLVQYRLGRKQSSFPMRLPYFFLLGVVVAFLSGIIGAIGPVQNPFFINYGVDKENLIATKALNTMVLQATKIMTYLSFGAITMDLASYGVAIGIGGIIGVYLAKHRILRMSTQSFHYYILALMFICGVFLALRSLTQIVQLRPDIFSDITLLS